LPHHRLGALAYAIWPNRVKEKCRTDLSFAIAHGLDDLCETAPKKDKEKKETKETHLSLAGKASSN